MKNRIPKQNPPSSSEKIIKQTPISKDEKITFSFSALERTKYFNLDVTCQNWSSELFDMLKNVSKYSKNDLISNKLQTYRVHNHEKASPPDPLPIGVALKDCYQIRISKSKGGIHGVFYENIFYVIWFDPLHNMYPDDKYGGLKLITPPKTCCKDREEIINELQNKIKDLQNKIIELQNDCEFWENEANNR